MSNIFNSLVELIGETPMLRLNNFEKRHNLRAAIIGKLEYSNPGGSVKDRIALKMINEAERNGQLKAGSTIIEPTSGNTGIGLALVAAARGYRIVLTMPDTMSVERRKLASAFGAEVVLTDGSRGMTGAIERAQELAAEIPGSYIPDQFENPANPQAHRETTGPEIWTDTDREIDFLVAGVGSGGTITGTGEFLKAQNPEIKVVAVEPLDSPVLSGGISGPHKIQGIGAGFIPKILNTKILDEIVAVKSEDAFETCKELARFEGLFAGISSGAAVWTAMQVAMRIENQGKQIVVILPDTGERYLSTPTFAE